jgi:hypothetical protein
MKIEFRKIFHERSPFRDILPQTKSGHPSPAQTRRAGKTIITSTIRQKILLNYYRTMTLDFTDSFHTFDYKP